MSGHGEQTAAATALKPEGGKDTASVLYASSKFLLANKNVGPKPPTPLQILAQKYTAIKGAPVRESEVWDMFCGELKEIFEECKTIKAGKNASYIPQLAKMNPDNWGVAVQTVDGKKFSIGDTTMDFSIQSCSKPIVYCMACEELGPEEVCNELPTILYSERQAHLHAVTHAFSFRCTSLLDENPLVHVSTLSPSMTRTNPSTLTSTQAPS